VYERAVNDYTANGLSRGSYPGLSRSDQRAFWPEGKLLGL